MLQQSHVPLTNGIMSFLEASEDYDLAPIGIGSMHKQAQKLAEFGRHGDIYFIHAAEGETVIPLEVLNANPKVKDMLFNQMREMGLDPEEFVVGNELNSINPVTGMPEFFISSVWRSVKRAVSSAWKSIKKAAPYVLPLVFSAFGVPFLSSMAPSVFGTGSFGAAFLGSGIGTLAAGGSMKDALKAGAVAGIGSAVWSGVTSIGSPEGFMGGVKQSFYNPNAADFPTQWGRFTEALDPEGPEGSFAEFWKGEKPSVPGADTSYLQKPDATPSATSVAAPARASAPAPVELNFEPGFARKSLGKQARAFEAARNAEYGYGPLAYGAPAPAPAPIVRPSQAPAPLPAPRAVSAAGPMGAALKDPATLTFQAQTAAKAAIKAKDAPWYSSFTGGPSITFEDVMNQLDPDVAAKMTTSAVEKAMANVNPGPLATYGPATGLGLLAAYAGGAFDAPKTDPVTEGDLAGFTGGLTGAELVEEDPGKYLVANLNPYRYDTGSPLVPTTYQAAQGGLAEYPPRDLLVEGAGTERSDEIPAMLSDGEFVMNARSVRGADPSGRGNRYAGANNLYNMMRNFEMRS